MQRDDDNYESPGGWTDIKPDVFAGAPFMMYGNHFKSGSARLKAFVENPRAFLRGDTVTVAVNVEEDPELEPRFETVEVAGEALEGVGPTTRISTWIVNHHRTLQRMILYATATVSPDEDAVYVTAWKQEP
jgi:hypothetical protein